jgi:DNA polymerase IV
MNRWMYIDFNCYFASCEQQLDPKIRNKPVAIIPVETDATCAIAASYEAKALGIKTGTPIWEAKKMCPHLICVLARHEVYVDFHEKIIEEIGRHLPVAKVCSIDEVACQLMENESQNAEKLAKKIKNGLKKNVGEWIRCSIGIAPNCYLAKIATDMQKPDGLTFINQEDLPQILYSLQLRDLVGIGSNMEIRLQKQGIFDVKKLLSLDMRQLRKAWGSVDGERLWHQLRGIELPDRITKRTTVGHSRVLAPELRFPERARQIGRRLISKAASRLRQMDMVASKVSFWARIEDDSFFEASVECDRVRDSFTFLSLFNGLWEEMIRHTGSSKIKHVAVTLLELAFTDKDQPVLFKDPSKEKKEQISDTLDRINQRYGRDSVSFGVLTDSEKSVTGIKISFTRIPKKDELNI